ncbi:hypothetical protein AeRB84_017963 [Aphanomyces euteiches]|nr:hypothetical protein AeRB84_017963 [Aphanomyces euteiches]
MRILVLLVIAALAWCKTQPHALNYVEGSRKLQFIAANGGGRGGSGAIGKIIGSMITIFGDRRRAKANMVAADVAADVAGTPSTANFVAKSASRVKEPDVVDVAGLLLNFPSMLLKIAMESDISLTFRLSAFESVLLPQRQKGRNDHGIF